MYQVPGIKLRTLALGSSTGDRDPRSAALMPNTRGPMGETAKSWLQGSHRPPRDLQENPFMCCQRELDSCPRQLCPTWRTWTRSTSLAVGDSGHAASGPAAGQSCPRQGTPQFCSGLGTAAESHVLIDGCFWPGRAGVVGDTEHPQLSSPPAPRPLCCPVRASQADTKEETRRLSPKAQPVPKLGDTASPRSGQILARAPGSPSPAV
ncbi:uncharacterized protein LOC104869253 [Fukomys damarensis]|uniref:uncharacterized protein LOC104869253 n=1 Tax=Fukomys damarensis TaxID=885580 RepID=UPI00053F7BBA|nr:uncharacterized protein LOC104869253 [Fukomys damarensis]